MIRTALGLILACLLSSGAADAATTTLIYGSAFNGPTGFATLWVGDTDGIGLFIGPIGFRRVGALDFSPGGILYGVGSNGTNTVLITINTATGAGTLVGPLGLGNKAFQDIAFRPSDGTLFGTATGDIYTINTTTGTATLVGDSGLGFPLGNALAFHGVTLYYANETALYTIAQGTGVATFVTDIDYQPAFGPGPRPPAMKFDPVTGTLWAAIVRNGFGFSLGTIDPATGQTAFVKGLPPGMDGIAVTTGGALMVPTLSEWAQIVLVAMLVLVALEALRRRRSALG